MNLPQIAHLLKEKGEPAYRLAQVKRAFYAEGCSGWDQLSTVSKELRTFFCERAPWDVLTPVTTLTSKEGDTVKVLFRCADGGTLESVLMKYEGGRTTVCLSSQIGCPMGCTFCATGTMGLKRNLTADEMVEQVVYFNRLLKSEHGRVANIVFMGMGEPMHNYDEVMRAIRVLNDPEALDIGARHISISTCGIVPGILRLADEPLQVNLAISLHSAVDATRSRIMPVNRAYPIAKLMAAVQTYAQTSNRKVLFEYLLLDGVNDTPEEARALAALIRKNPKLYHVNLIKYHDTAAYTGSSMEKRETFFDMLKRLYVPVTFRKSFGEDIDAACGQLATKEEAGHVVQGVGAAKKYRSEKHSASTPGGV